MMAAEESMYCGRQNMAPLAMAAVRIWSARQIVAGGAAGRQAAWAVSLTGSRTGAVAEVGQ
jgi:hypothetical protein